MTQLTLNMPKGQLVAAKNFWTDDNQDLLVKMWENGASARAIAEALGGGITRNAVIGKANRMGLSQQPKKALLVEEPEKLTMPSAKQCRWPFGDPNDVNFHFCGKPIVPDWPYCQNHCNEAYRTLNDRDNEPKAESPPKTEATGTSEKVAKAKA